MVKFDVLDRLPHGVDYDVREIERVVSPTSEVAFLRFLCEAVEAGRLSTHVIVSLPGGAQHRFETIADVPNELPDADGALVRLHVEHVHVRYTVLQGVA